MTRSALIASALKRFARNRPLRLTLTLLQLTLAAAVVTVALHVLYAERSRGASQALFDVQAAAPGGQIVLSHAPFTPDSVRDLLALAPDVEAVAVYSSLHFRPKVEVDGEVYMLSSVGQVDAAYLDLLDITITRGVGFALQQARPEGNGILLEEDVATTLFRGSDPIGRELALLPFNSRSGRSVEYKVVGTYRYPASSPTGDVGALRKLPALLPSPPGGSSDLVVLPEPGMDEAAREQVLAAARQVYAGQMRQHDGLDFFVREGNRPLRYFETIEPHLLLFALFGVTALILAGVAVFSMTVVEVSEQAHQIGIKRVLGANRWHVAGEHVAAAGLQALIAGGVGAIAALALVPVLRAELGDSLIPGDSLSSQPLLALAAFVLILVLSVGLGLVPALNAGRTLPAALIRER